MTLYANLGDLQNLGIARLFLNKATVEQQKAELEAASAIADYHLAARYTLPILSWPQSLREACCKIATYKLMAFVGYNPDNDTDKLIRQDYEDAMKWLTLVQKQQAHPLFVDSSVSGGGNPQPQVTSSSVVDIITGRCGRNRSW